uniref:Secreted protein n=1 Tax=Anguilla anguilla TaxID=7936 RepID=A0A0E9SJ92_ANGAN
MRRGTCWPPTWRSTLPRMLSTTAASSTCCCHTGCPCPIGWSTAISWWTPRLCSASI